MAARDICMYVCMYVYVRQALGPITPRACTNGTESAIFEKFFYWERKLWKKRSLANGALAALDFKFGS